MIVIVPEEGVLWRLLPEPFLSISSAKAYHSPWTEEHITCLLKPVPLSGVMFGCKPRAGAGAEAGRWRSREHWRRWRRAMDEIFFLCTWILESLFKKFGSQISVIDETWGCVFSALEME